MRGKKRWKAEFYHRFMSQLICVLSVSLILTAGFPVSAAQASSYGQYLSGEGKKESEMTENQYTQISISTEEDLLWLAGNCQLDSWSGDKYIRLENDISLERQKDISIPVFGGIFDGCGFTISGLDIQTAGSAKGLFRYIQEGGEVRNLTVSGQVQPGGSRSQTGILAGVNYGRIINCTVSGSVVGASETGGVAGVNEETGEIRVCASFAIVTGDHYTGGICGTNKGVLNNCSNSGNVNTYSREVAYDLEDLTVENLEDANSMEKIAAHTDTGGIAGYSEGKIYYCSNSGAVGYQHVGYNVGGIVGRLHQGYLQNCTNSGHILGRKDVGGIAGQMEPFWEIQYLNDQLSQLDAEVDIFLDLLQKTNEDLGGLGAEAAHLGGEIGVNLQNISFAAGNLTGAASDLWYIYNQELTGVSSDYSRLNQEWSNLAALDRERAEEGAKWAEQIDFTISGNEWPTVSGNGGSINKPEVSDPFPNAESYAAALRRFGESANGRLTVMNAAAKDKSGGIDTNLEILDAQMREASFRLVSLMEVLEEGAMQTSGNGDALIEQALVLHRLFGEIRDDLFCYEKISVEDVSDEAAGGGLEDPGADSLRGEEVYYDTGAFQKGKITLCLNRGLVEADTAVGGIVGQVAAEYDFDPEDDISVEGTESFHIEQSVKAVVRESRNLGDVAGKKDYVGGIVGRADFGAVISCEAYGNVESAGGSYVGGIAGSSGYCVRSCYYMGELSGKDCVGGIVGRGSDLFYNYAYPEIGYSGERAGSIAGSLAKEGVLYGNYYVQEDFEQTKKDSRSCVPGIDSVGYEHGAEPLSYEEFASREEVPEAFREFTVRFQADGKELAAVTCRYGDGIDPAQIPEVPSKEGFYGMWPEYDYTCVTGNRVLEAEYEKWVTSLADTKQNEGGRPKALVQGKFRPEAFLTLEETPEGTEIVLHSFDSWEENTDGFVVRVFGKDAENAVVELWNGTGYTRTPAKVMGSYLEFAVNDFPKQDGDMVLCVYKITEPEQSGAGGAAAAAVIAGMVVLLAALLLFARRKRRRAPVK